MSARATSDGVLGRQQSVGSWLVLADSLANVVLHHAGKALSLMVLVVRHGRIRGINKKLQRR